MYKSCLDFVNSIGYENFTIHVGNHFDHMMALYRLCGSCQFKSISSAINGDIVEFEIIFRNKQEAHTFNCILYNASIKIIQVFDRLFSYDCEQINPTTLKVRIRPFS